MSNASTRPELSTIVVSFNTREVLRNSLEALQAASTDVRHEIIVVDNASHDGSADMVSAEFPEVVLIRAPYNLGFAAACNKAWQAAKGEFVALVNPDAFLERGALRHAIDRMRDERHIGLAGGLLLGKDGRPEPSARLFPSPLNDFLSLSGLAARFSRSRFFGRFDRTWADPNVAAEVDWVPGALAVIRASALEEVGFFDERFFLYYEEVDLCRRLKAAGYTVEYMPEMRATHWGGESSKTVSNTHKVSRHGRQLTLWRMRSALLYYRKHHGLFTAALAARIEIGWHTLRRLRNWRRDDDKRDESASVIDTMRQAWNDTLGGRVAPPRPW